MLEDNIKDKLVEILHHRDLNGYSVEKQCDDIYNLIRQIEKSDENNSIAHRLKITKLPFIVKDDRGNEIYHEDAKNNWCRYEYDKQDRVTFCEFSNNGWYKYTYLENGKYVYENSEGTIKGQRSK